MDLSNLRWLDKLPKTMTEVAGKLALHLGEDAQTVTSQLKGALTSVARMAMDLVWAHTGQDAHGGGKDGTLRFANGVLPEALHRTSATDPISGHWLVQSAGSPGCGRESHRQRRSVPSRAVRPALCPTGWHCAALWAAW